MSLCANLLEKYISQIEGSLLICVVVSVDEIGQALLVLVRIFAFQLFVQT